MAVEVNWVSHVVSVASEWKPVRFDVEASDHTELVMLITPRAVRDQTQAGGRSRKSLLIGLSLCWDSKEWGLDWEMLFLDRSEDNWQFVAIKRQKFVFCNKMLDSAIVEALMLESCAVASSKGFGFMVCLD